MNFRSWQRWQLIEYALLQKISEEKAVENGKALPQTKSEFAKIYAIAIHETAGLKTAPDAALFAIFTVNPVLVTDE